MFNEIPRSVLDRMHVLEQRDSQDRADGTTRMERLRQIPPETGRFIALWAAASRLDHRGRYERRLLDALVGARVSSDRAHHHDLRDTSGQGAPGA
jgi:hypothetical protein